MRSYADELRDELARQRDAIMELRARADLAETVRADALSELSRVTEERNHLRRAHDELRAVVHRMLYRRCSWEEAKADDARLHEFVPDIDAGSAP